MECNYTACGRPVQQPRHCPGCKKKFYCSQQCRLADWYSGHELQCGLEHSPSSGRFKLQDFQTEDQKPKVLGKGSYGEVRLVVHTPTQEKYALKVLSKSQFQRESSMQVLKREITLHSALDHPHIIKLFDHLEDSTNVYLVLEYANRGSLFHEIHRQKRLSEDKARNYFKQTCEAVQYLHENDIIHRDIKPENILLDDAGTIKLCDFGWCAKGNETRTTFCGTLDYMAPEMVMGAGHNFAIDVWALGVLLFEMTHGRAPFTARKESEKCQQILKLVYSFEPGMSPELKDLIEKLLKLVPEDRLSIEKVLTHAWITGVSAQNQELIGAMLKNYVKGYGIAEGIISSVQGELCTIFYQVPNITETLPIAKVMKIIKRKNAGVKGSNVFDDPKDLDVLPPAEEGSPEVQPADKSAAPPAPIPDIKTAVVGGEVDDISPLVPDVIAEKPPSVTEVSIEIPKANGKIPNPDPEFEEKVLLERIEKWCKVPSKIPVKSDKFLQELEETNKKLEDSLWKLKQQKPQNAEIVVEKVKLGPVKKLDFPQLPPLSIGESIDLSVTGKSPSDIPESEPTPQAMTPAYILGFADVSRIDSRESQAEIPSPKFGSKEKGETAALYAKLQDDKPVFSELAEKHLETDVEAKMESDSLRSGSQEHTHAPKEKPCDFEGERLLIEEKNCEFYTVTQTRWADDRGSKTSVVPAPVLTLHSAPVSELDSQAGDESVDCPPDHCLSPDDRRVGASQYAKSNSALQRRKRQLEALLKEVHEMPVIPRARRPEPPKEKKGTFLRWLGDVMGCGNRY